MNLSLQLQSRIFTLLLHQQKHTPHTCCDFFFCWTSTQLTTIKIHTCGGFSLCLLLRIEISNPSFWLYYMITFPSRLSLWKRAFLSICLHSKLGIHHSWELKRLLFFSGIRDEQVVLPPAASLWIFCLAPNCSWTWFLKCSLALEAREEEKTGHDQFCY